MPAGLGATKCDAENTEQMVADEVGVSQQAVNLLIKDFTKNGKSAEISKNFKPYLYKIWRHTWLRLRRRSGKQQKDDHVMWRN